MNILYISSVCSQEIIEQIRKSSGINPGLAIQNFNRLMLDGFHKNNCNVTVLSNPPITRQLSKQIVVNLPNTVENGVHYQYIPFLNIRFVKHLCVFIYTFLYVLFWKLKFRGDQYVVCDVLSKSAAMAALFASKIRRHNIVGIVTDLPWLVVPEGKEASRRPKHSFLYRFTHYILLTEYMNTEINIYEKPYIVVEGLCPEKLNVNLIRRVESSSVKTIMYAGTLMEKYGLKTLVESFLKANIPNAKLVIYGDGPYSETLRNICRETDKVEYMGLVSSTEIFEAEQKATLLVNPRPSNDVYTKYSFPSKTIEYMLSGTPLLTTNLPGIPIEYKEHLFVIDDESQDGFIKTLKTLTNMNPLELQRFGRVAQEFVLYNKNNRKQVSKIIAFLKSGIVD